MNQSKIWLLVMMVISWFAIPSVGLKNIKRFIPSYFFIIYLLSLEKPIAKKQKWWTFPKELSKKIGIGGEFPFVLGPYLATILWTMKLTFNKFPLFFLMTTLTNLIYAYPVRWMLEKSKIFTLRIEPFNFFLLMQSKSLMKYGFQKFIESRPKEETPT